jgi:hypothetical protein
MEINKEVSYMIGLFQTDGTLYKQYKDRNKGKFQIEISDKDKDIINKIVKYIPYNYGIRKRTRNTKINNRDYIKDYISLSVSNLEFRTFLNESGIPYGKKSQIIKPPLHLKDLSIKDYVRGLYDGDGSLGLDSKGIPFISFTTDSDGIANFLVDYISKLTNKPKKKLNRNKRDNIYNIVITKEDAQVLTKELYYGGCLSIKRKKNKAKDVLNWIRPKDMKKIYYERKGWDKEQDKYILNHSIEESMKHLDRTGDSIKMRLFRLKKL